MSMSEDPVIPSADEIKKLPRWARVAFAARCTRRVQPLFTHCWPTAPSDLVKKIDQAIRVSENAAGAADASDVTDAPTAARAAALAAPAAARAVALAARAAARAALTPTPPLRSEREGGPTLSPHRADEEQIRTVLLDVIAEKTGYPAEMLGLDMALEADLGIDSIKLVEICFALQERLPEAPGISPERLGDLRHIADFLPAVVQTSDVAAHAAAAHAAGAAAYRVGPGITRRVAEAIRVDYEFLRERSRIEQWDDSTPVPPSAFGLLWPEGPPPGWPTDAPPTLTDESASETSSTSTKPDIRLVLTATAHGDIDVDTITEDLLELYKAINAYHIARGGTGLELEDFRRLIRSAVGAEV